MHILFVTSTEREIHGGAARLTSLLGETLTARGHQVDVVWFSDVQQRVPARMRHRNKHFSFPLAVIPTIAEWQRRRGQYDIVQIWSGDACLYGIWKRLRHRTRAPLLIKDTHGLEHRWWEVQCEEARAGRREPIPLRQKIIFPLVRLNQVCWSARLSDHVICHSTSDLGYIVGRHWIERAKATCIPHGIPDSYIAAGTKRGERGRGLLFVGTWEVGKGIYDLRDAFLRILEKQPDVHLSLLGTRVPVDTVLASFPREVVRQIRVVPLLSESELIDEYLAHDVFLFPSLYEGFGMVVLEAMACGLSVVATPVGGAADIIEDGVDGFLVPFRDSQALAETALRLLDSESLRETVEDRARRKASGYSWGQIVNTYEALYAQLLADHHHR